MELVKSKLLETFVMRFPSTKLLLTGLFALGAMVAGAQETMSEKLERENRQLKLQLANLNTSLSASLEREDSKTKALKEIREYLALRGRDLFEDRDTKLLNAVSDYQVARENLVQLEDSVGSLLPIIKNYLRTAVASNPEFRKEVEVKLREIEVALGQRQQPKRKIEKGSIREARVVTVDSDSGLVVINAGSDADVGVGMRFRIERSGTHICDSSVGLVRADVSGLLLLPLNNPDVTVQPGDLAKIITL